MKNNDEFVVIDDDMEDEEVVIDDDMEDEEESGEDDGTNDYSEAPTQSPAKAIRLKCLDCSGENVAEVRRCPVKGCALYPFRFGKNPFRKKREMSEEHLLTLKKARMARGKQT